MSELCYLDSSALVKLVVDEQESAALRGFLERAPAMVSSALAAVEVRRALRRVAQREDVLWVCQQVMAAVGLLNLDERVLAVAAELPPAGLRTLDALHLASALSLGADLAMMVVYDGRLAAAARGAGLSVLAPK